MFDQKHSASELKITNEIKYPEIKAVELDRALFSDNCDILRDKLIHLMITAADKVLQPLIVQEGISDSDSLRLAFSRNIFVKTLQTKSLEYQHNISGYIRHEYKHKRLKRVALTQEKDIIGFKNLMQMFYVNRPCFGLDGLSVNGEGLLEREYFNFNRLLQLIIQLEVLRLEGQDINFPSQQLLLQQYQQIQQEIKDFEKIVNSDVNLLSNFLRLRPPFANYYNSWSLTDYQFLNDNLYYLAYQHRSYSGNRGAFWWLMPDFVWDVHDSYRSIDFSIGLSRALLTFLFSQGAVSKIYEEKYCLNNILYISQAINRSIYYSNSISFKQIHLTALTGTKILDSFLINVPLMLLLGLTSLPWRFFHMLNYWVFGPGRIGLPEHINFILLFFNAIITTALSLTLGLSLFLITLPIKVAAYLLIAITYPILMKLASLVFKDFSRPSTGNQQINQLLLAEPFEAKSDKVHFIVFKNQVLQEIAFLREHKNITKIHFNWNFYKAESHGVLREDIQVVADYLRERKEPLNVLSVEANNINEQTIKIIFEALMNNPAINPHTIAFKTENYTNAMLVMLIGLVSVKQSIIYVPLPERLASNEQCWGNYQTLTNILKKRQETMSRAVEDSKDRESKSRSFSFLTCLSSSSSRVSASGHSILTAPGIASIEPIDQISGDNIGSLDYQYYYRA